MKVNDLIKEYEEFEQTRWKRYGREYVRYEREYVEREALLEKKYGDYRFLAYNPPEFDEPTLGEFIRYLKFKQLK